MEPGVAPSHPFQWDPADYAASSASQARWGQDLIRGLQWRGDEQVLDVGCGDGQLTALLAGQVPDGRVLGIDNSPHMIAHARACHPEGDHPNLQFRQMDAASIHLPREFDIVFSNAALHWVADHPAFLRGAARALRQGGRLMVSCGGKGNAAEVFLALRRQMRSHAWRAFFRKIAKPYFFHSDEEYRQWLPATGFQPVTIRLAARAARHAGVEAFTGWFRTTWMPYTHRVPEDKRSDFIAAVVNQYLAMHPPDPDGAVIVNMVRLELDAVRV
jgi:trans-aconitate methyltransferase